MFWCALLWAVGLQTCRGAPGDSVELATGSSHPRGEGAGLLPALVWRLLLGVRTLPACSAQRPPRASLYSKTRTCLQSKTLWLACSSYLRERWGWGRSAREEYAPGPQRVGKTSLPERHGGSRKHWKGRLSALHSFPGLPFALSNPPFVYNVGGTGWEDTSSGSLWISYDVIYTPGLWGHLYKFQKFIRKQIFYSMLFPFLF